MSILEFADRLAEELRRGTIPQNLRNETAFERDFVVPTAIRVITAFPDVHIYTHSFGNRDVCSHGCMDAAEDESVRVIGCPECWRLSKDWATVSAFGMRHGFDLVARDRGGRGRTLAVEVKWIHFVGKRAPNGEFQRFLGQCAIASSRHHAVIGVAGIRGGPSGEEPRYSEQRDNVLEAFEKLGVRLVILQAPEDLGKVEIAAT